MKNQSPGVPMQPIEVVQQQMLALNVPQNPFKVKVEGNKVIGEWKIVDAQWTQAFEKAGLSRSYTLVITLHPDGTADYLDKSFDVSWEAGVPTVANPAAGGSMSFFIGKKTSTVRGFSLDLRTGKKDYDYSFSTKQIKKPMFEVLERCGWKLKTGFFERIFGL